MGVGEQQYTLAESEEGQVDEGTVCSPSHRNGIVGMFQLILVFFVLSLLGNLYLAAENKSLKYILDGKGRSKYGNSIP